MLLLIIITVGSLSAQMKQTYDVGNKRLTITGCPYQGIEIVKDGQTIADIPLTKGEGFITNLPDDTLTEGTDLTGYVYDRIKIKIGKSNEAKMFEKDDIKNELIK